MNKLYINISNDFRLCNRRCSDWDKLIFSNNPEGGVHMLAYQNNPNGDFPVYNLTEKQEIFKKLWRELIRE